jgi:hypothetical protein
MPKAKSPRTIKPKNEKNLLQMPENGNAHNGSTPADLESEIRLRAYQLYEQRGGTPGFEQQDWLSAEREILARHPSQTHTA